MKLAQLAVRLFSKGVFALANNIELRLFYRLRFEKLDLMRFIGHLDLLTIFQRSVRRAGLPIAYSEGFNPHQIMSFALPLPLGVESVGEYVEIELTKEVSAGSIVASLNNALPNGLKILEARLLRIGEKNAAASVCAANYEITFDKSVTKAMLEKAVNTIIEQNEIVVEKKSKKGTKLVDIRPLIFCIEVSKGDEGFVLQAVIAAGSTVNLKAELVAKQVCETLGFEFEEVDIKYLRRQLLQGAEGKFVQL